MSFIKTLGQTIMQMIDTHQKSQVLRIFKDMSDKQLADIGISRAALSKGIKAYPWHEISAENTAAAVQTADVLTFKKAAPATQQQTMDTQPKLAA